MRSRIIEDAMLYSVMVSIVRGNCYRTIANMLCKIPDLNSEIVQCVANSVRNECKSMTKRDQSILQKTTPADMVTLSFKETAAEIKKQMPTNSLHSFG